VVACGQASAVSRHCVNHCEAARWFSGLLGHSIWWMASWRASMIARDERCGAAGDEEQKEQKARERLGLYAYLFTTRPTITIYDDETRLTMSREGGTITKRSDDDDDNDDDSVVEVVVGVKWRYSGGGGGRGRGSEINPSLVQSVPSREREREES